jgi:hypothetical protein
VEGCGLVFATPITFITSLVFCLLAHLAFRRWPRLPHIGVAVAFVIVTALAIEVLLSLRVGPFHLYERFGRAYWTLHMVGFFFGPPAIAVLVLVAVSRFIGVVFVRVGLATAFCWFACMATLVANIMVDEDIVGIEQSGERPTRSVFPP